MQRGRGVESDMKEETGIERWRDRKKEGERKGGCQ